MSSKTKADTWFEEEKELVLWIKSLFSTKRILHSNLLIFYAWVNTFNFTGELVSVNTPTTVAYSFELQLFLSAH